MTNWKSLDYRLESLIYTIEGLQNAITELEKKLKDPDWHDGLWNLEEVEPIIGLSFIAFQNYINSSIYDRYESLENQSEKYKLGEPIKRTGRTDIELIIGIANYYKHRDDHRNLHTNTRLILTDFNLEFDKETDLTDSAVLRGLEYLSKKWKLKPVIEIVTNWREKLWIEK